MNWKANRRVIATLLVVALMLVAGCTGPADGGNGTVAGEGDGAGVGPTEEGGAGAGGDDGGAGASDGMSNETEDAAASLASPLG